ncbi:TetR family transcriptional regulator [Nocardioides sp. zg-536]|uniref:TetR family transcriptional regulator n=1 Tax=Nocardioides faecalis TaxID=2803858 RepID=A0A939BZC6_9ACTN|nr:TetR/AcrR family transcriptional regulator [Nocardioides faecalis]MBM9461173.1 TetR family transcriptional regulator [Nocardioides faecalis]MBS4752174.1 TetR family transcriptional regulator [Nocardioides faecalis]QVI59022.1 TetR family transcriptional regulator [Nocardioides faecalis]
MKSDSEGGAPRSGRRKWPDGYDPQRTRGALIQSALDLFERDGFDRTTLQQIVDGAGLTKGAFYHHFQSKEDVLWQIQNEYLDSQIEAATAIREKDDDPVEQLRALIRLSLGGVESHRAHVTIFSQERRHLTGQRLETVAAKRNELESLFLDAVQRGIDTGVFRDSLTGRIATFGIIGMCAGAFQWYRPDGRLGIDEIADQFCELILDGLRP